jgi:hypothetical protein
MMPSGRFRLFARLLLVLLLLPELLSVRCLCGVPRRLRCRRLLVRLLLLSPSRLLVLPQLLGVCCLSSVPRHLRSRSGLCLFARLLRCSRCLLLTLLLMPMLLRV